MSTKHEDAVKAFMEKRAKEIAAVKARKEAEREAKAKAKRELLRAEREEYSAQKKAAREAEKAKERALQEAAREEKAAESLYANAKSLAQATLTTYVKHKQCVPRELLPELHKEYLLEHVYLILAAEKDVSRAQVREALQTLLE